KSKNEMQINALDLMNQLLPSQQQLALADMHNPLQHMQDTAQQVTYEMRKKIFITFLSSDVCRDVLRNSFKLQDFQRIMDVMSVDKHIQVLAEELLAQGVERFDKELIVTVLKTQHPS